MLTWGRERPFLVFIKTATAHGPGPPRGPQDGCLHRGGSRAPRACPSDRQRGHGCETKHGHRAIRALKNEERMPHGTRAEPPPGASLCPPVCLHHLSGPHGQARLSGSRRALPPASDEPGSGGHSPPGHCPSGTTWGCTQPRRPRCPGPGAGPAREHSRAAFSTKRIPALSRGDGQQNRWLCQRGQCDRCDGAARKPGGRRRGEDAKEGSAH